MAARPLRFAVVAELARHWAGERKVRAPQGKVVGNAHRGPCNGGLRESATENIPSVRLRRMDKGEKAGGPVKAP